MNTKSIELFKELFSEQNSPIEIKKKRLLDIAGKLNECFDDAVESIVSEQQQQCKKLEIKIACTKQKLEKNLNTLTQTQRFYNTLPEMHDDLCYDYSISEEQLLAIETMKVIYLYKSFEILLKNMIIEAFTDINIKKLYQWKIIESKLGNNGITLKEIKEYQGINELRLVNNNVKHSDVIDNEFKEQNIYEFEGNDSFNFSSIANFYSRAKNKPKIFLQDLAEKLIVILDKKAGG